MMLTTWGLILMIPFLALQLFGVFDRFVLKRKCWGKGDTFYILVMLAGFVGIYLVWAN